VGRGKKIHSKIKRIPEILTTFLYPAQHSLPLRKKRDPKTASYLFFSPKGKCAQTLSFVGSSNSERV